MREERRLYIVGSFVDHPSRILSYSTAARSIGLDPFFTSGVEHINCDSVEPNQILFTDDSSICDSLRVVSARGKNNALEAKLRNLALLCDKYKVRQLFAGQFPHEFRLIQKTDEIQNFEDFASGWVCKPRWGSNSRDVAEFSSVEELTKCAGTILSRDNHALIERNIEGRHVCVDFDWNGRDLTMVGFCSKRMASSPNKIVEAFHTLELDVGAIAGTVGKMLSPVFEENFSGAQFFIHGEFIIEESTQNIKIAELNPRPPWGFLPELFSIGFGLNFDLAVVANAVGLPASQAKKVYPSVLGMVFSSSFFKSYHDVRDRGNTLYVDQLLEVPVHSAEETDLKKYGRFLLWGSSSSSVKAEWDDLAAIAMPGNYRELDRSFSSNVWKSKCC